MSSIFRLLCLDRDALLEAKGDTEDNSAPKSAMEKPPGTPDMSAHETKDMVYSILRDSPLPDTERSDDNSQRMVEVASFQRRRMMVGSFPREATIN